MALLSEESRESLWKFVLVSAGFCAFAHFWCSDGTQRLYLWYAFIALSGLSCVGYMGAAIRSRSCVNVGVAIALIVASVGMAVWWMIPACVDVQSGAAWLAIPAILLIWLAYGGVVVAVLRREWPELDD